jgi:hypothetical protein
MLLEGRKVLFGNERLIGVEKSTDPYILKPNNANAVFRIV